MFADLREAGRNEDRAGDLLGSAVGEHPRDEGRGYAEDGDVDVPRHVGDARIAGVVEYRFGPRMDGIDRAFVAPVDEVSHHRVADLAVFGGRPDHRHGIRLHDAPHGIEYGIGAWAIAGLRGRTELYVMVDGERPVSAREHGIQVQFRDLRKIGYQATRIGDQRCQRGSIGQRRRPAHP